MKEGFSFKPERAATDEEVSEFDWSLEDGKQVLRRIRMQAEKEPVLAGPDAAFRIVREHEYGIDLQKHGLSERQRVALKEVLKPLMALAAHALSPTETMPQKRTEIETVSDALADTFEERSAFVEEVAALESQLDDLETDKYPQFQAELERYIEWITNREVNGTRYLDMALAMAEQPVVGAPEFTRDEYVVNQIEFIHPYTKQPVPETIETELRRLIPGLCIQESGFDNGLMSPAGAVGIMQQMPATIRDEGYQVEEVRLSLKKQVELAGGYFAKIYTWLMKGIDQTAMRELEERHTPEELERDVVVPLMLTSYNAGAGRVSAAVNEYFKIPENRDKELAGKDLFDDIVRFAKASETGTLARFGADAEAYAKKIYANSIAFDRLKQQRS